ncbi:MAG: neutral zinc metallopeptidase [Acidobacteriota bacterium]
MRWTPGNRGDIDDQRGRSGIRGGVPLGIGGVVVLLFLSWATGTDFLSQFGSVSPASDSSGPAGPAASSPAEERSVDFVGAVMKDVQETWSRLLSSRYEPTRLVLFRDGIESGCGSAQSATGPFYCPSDQLVYLDLGFFDELKNHLGAPGEFAQAYVIAHEVGHHVQHLLGIDDRARAVQSRPGSGNASSVALELQADCFAGVWGHTAAQPGRAAAGKVELDPGDVEAGLTAAAAIGDDRLQRMATGHVAPDRFTHGSSAQRVEWFKKGLTTGSPDACDTFGRRESVRTTR